MNKETRPSEIRDLSDKFRASARPTLTVDVEKYQAWLDETDLSQEQKEEFLQALWSIVVSFVEMGFGVHPLQEICGQDDLDDAAAPKLARDQVQSEHAENRKPE
jgi:hypothetical protein